MNIPNGTAIRQAGAQGSEPDAPSTQHPPKRNRQHRKNHSQSMPQVDGTVSDSVTNTMASPRSKRQPKPRQQSVAMGALPNENIQANGHKPRHASVGGNMIPTTPFKEQAYAGPTFQASPAPSSLPVPKFASRSVPNVAAHKSFEARLASEKAQENEKSSPETDHATPPPRGAQQSPLDVLFNADRAEKEKRLSDTRLSPEMAARPRPPMTEPRNPFQQTGKSVFLREMDGDDGPMISPRTVPPNNRPTLHHRTSSSSEFKAFEMDSESERESYTKNLKDLLMNNVNGTPPPADSRSTQRPHTSSRPATDTFHTPSPFQRSTSGPSTPTPTTDQQTQYQMHYGNRNLSPLFKAARSETPPKPSGLRKQELASEINPTHPQQQQQLPQIDPNSFSRNYLDTTIRNSQPGLPPNLPVNVHQTQQPTPPSYSSAPGSQHGVPASSAAPRTASSGSAGGGGGTSNDIKTMEDDLRRMLKLNVLSN